MENNIWKYAITNAVLTAAYIFLVGFFMSSAEKIFGKGEDTVLIPIAMILLFVFSASLTGALMLGRPILWYLDGKKKEAVTLFANSLIVIFLVLIMVFIAMGLIS